MDVHWTLLMSYFSGGRAAALFALLWDNIPVTVISFLWKFILPNQLKSQDSYYSVHVHILAAKLTDVRETCCRKRQDLPHTHSWLYYRWYYFSPRCGDLSVKGVGTPCKQPWTSITAFKGNRKLWTVLTVFQCIQVPALSCLSCSFLSGFHFQREKKCCPLCPSHLIFFWLFWHTKYKSRSIFWTVEHSSLSPFICVLIIDVLIFLL